MNQFLKFFLASVLGFFVSIFLVFVIAGILFAGIITALSDKSAKPSKDMVIELNLNYQINEQTEENPFLELMDKMDQQALGLDKILHNIKRASKDENVRGIILRPGMVVAGFGTLEEIRNALIDFKKSGKFVYAYCEFITEKSYLLSTACDSIFLNPAGEIVMDGLSSNVMFYKGMLEKLGVEMELFKVGTHKGAAEVFTQKQLSQENKDQIQRYLDVLYDNFCTDAAKSRGIDKNTFKQMVSDFSVQNPVQAIEANWIDGLWYEDQVADLIKEKIGKDKEEKICFTSLASYWKMEGPSLKNNTTKNKIAYIYVDGEISTTTDESGKSSCKSLLKSIRKIRYDDSYKALVVRVNSPGGSAYGSDQIWREIQLVKEVKPVIVSMGDIAASGGYYLAAPADTIVVSKYTLTGSIGVFALFPNLDGFLNDKLGLTFETVTTGKHAGMGMPGRGFTDTERQIIQNSVNRVYANFTSVVANGRGLDSAKVESVAQGKVWIAEDAKKHNLVDVVGGIQSALNIAAFKAGIGEDDYNIVYLPKKDDFLTSIFQTYAKTSERKIETELGEFYPYYLTAQKLKNTSGMQMKLPFIPIFD